LIWREDEGVRIEWYLLVLRSIVLLASLDVKPEWYPLPLRQLLLLELVGGISEALGRLQSLPALQATVVCLEQVLWVACCWLAIVIVGVLLNDLTTFGAGLWICPGAVRKSCCWLVSVILRSELRTKLPA